METSINNIPRTMSQQMTEVKLKQSHPVDKRGEILDVSNSVKEPSFKAVELQSKGVNQVESGEIEENIKEEEGVEKPLAEVVNNINTALTNVNRTIQFNLDVESDQTVIKIVDTASGDEIKQIPSEEMMEISRRLAEYLGEEEVVGMLLKNKV